MKLRVKCEPNEDSRSFTVDTTDLGYTDEEWNELSEEAKLEAIHEEIDGYEQPYWIVDKFSEITK